MHTLRTSFLARAVLAIAAFVMALARFHWVRWVPGVPFKGAPRFFTVRCANAWSLHCGPLWLTVPMPWSRVFLTGTAISCPWMLPKKSGIRTALGLSVLLLLLSPLTASAQTAEIRPGVTPLAFDHDGLDTVRYELCVGGACTPIATTRDGGVVRFVAPASLPRGEQLMAVRAVGEAGVSAPSTPVTFRVVVIPSQPGPLRIEVAPSGE